VSSSVSSGAESVEHIRRRIQRPRQRQVAHGPERFDQCGDDARRPDRPCGSSPHRGRASGPFHGCRGIIEDRANESRLIVQVDVAGRTVTLESHGAQVETIDG
jgi:hypothetical protein